MLYTVSDQPLTTHARVGGVEAQIGQTPLIPLRRLSHDLPPGVRLWVKAEWFNAGGSVKARPARHIIYDALRRGWLDGRRLLDATSGNTGIAYATLGAALGIPVTLAMPANASPERIAILRGLGVELLLTDPEDGVDGAQALVQRLAEEHPDRYFWANQYDNPANWLAHYETTGPEIWAQTHGRITHLVAGTGTGGTLMGTGRYLREQNPTITLVAVQPKDPDHGIEGLKHMEATRRRPAIYDPSFPDVVVRVRPEDAYAMARELARREGLFVGLSAAAIVWAMLRVAHEIRQGCFVAVLPDAGYKYLSGLPWREPSELG
ncbi:MAG: cysteine synthase family protein [Chloroflexi bacterium]|nr:cysteine synthase family protein [Chloroflexota bacterium]